MTSLSPRSCVLLKWNNSEFGLIKDHIRRCEEKIDFIDKIANVRLQCANEMHVRKEAQMELWTWQKRNESYWAQLSREKWIKEGDRNTKYFVPHPCIC